MHNMNALKAEMVRHGISNSQLAESLGISTRTLSSRFKTEDFGSVEIEKMIKLLKLKRPWEIFFTN